MKRLFQSPPDLQSRKFLIPMIPKTKLLFVDDEKGYRESFYRFMSIEKTFLIETASDGMEALKKLKTFPADIVITDVLMPGMDGLSLLKEIRERYPDILVPVVTGYGSIDNAVQAMKLGAYDYILKPFDFDMIKMVIEKIVSHRRILQENIFSEKERRKGYRFKNIIGRDPEMYKVFQMIADVAKTNVTVLITGESGTGKELVAEAIHYRSLRRENTLNWVCT